MKKTKKVGTLFLALLALTVTLTLTLDKTVNAQQPLETIFIQPDGSVSPNTAPIHQNGNTYTLTDNIYAAIKILKSNIILDGAGYALTGSFKGNSTNIWVVGQGPNTDSTTYYTIGVDLGNRSICGVTIQNLKVKNFSIGMYIWTQNNTIKSNVVSNNILGLLISGSNATMTDNYISDNIEGLFFGFNSPGTFPPDMVVYQNAFLRNNVQLGGCQCQSYNLSEAPHNWDNGITGNYWSDYKGTDANKDGKGERPYVIDILDVDRFPIMQKPIKSSAQPANFPVETVVLGVSISFMLVAVAFAVKQRRKRRSREETSK
jgi:parallel beta-helix repeat protein